MLPSKNLVRHLPDNVCRVDTSDRRKRRFSSIAARRIRRQRQKGLCQKLACHRRPLNSIEASGKRFLK